MCIVELGRKVTKEIVLSYSTVKWLVHTLQDCSHAEVTKDFIRTSKSGNNAFIAQMSSNVHGRYLTSVGYRRGGGHKDFIIISEERDSRGWRKLAMEQRGIFNIKQNFIAPSGGVTQRSYADMVTGFALTINGGDQIIQEIGRLGATKQGRKGSLGHSKGKK